MKNGKLFGKLLKINTAYLIPSFSIGLSLSLCQSLLKTNDTTEIIC